MSTISSITALGTGFSVMKKVLEVRDIAPAGDGWTCTLRMSPGPRDARGARGECGRLRLRERVIPKPAAPPPPQLPLDFDPAESSPTSSPRPRRIGWAKLLACVFALDITRCRKCGGRMRVLEVVSDPDAIARILHGARAPPAPPPGQLRLLP